MICPQCSQGSVVSDSGQGGATASALGVLGRAQAGPRTAQGGHREGSWPREGMRERRKSRGGEERRDGVGFEFPFPFGQKGREGGFCNPPSFYSEHGSRGF